MNFGMAGMEQMGDEMMESSAKILRLLDAAEKDSTCRYNRMPHYYNGEVVDWYYVCDKCKEKEYLYPQKPHCPGCGRRIVKEEEK